jgi:hypothetical protein
LFPFFIHRFYFRTLPGQAAFDLVADFGGSQQHSAKGEAIGVKDQAIIVAFDINGVAIVAPFSAVGDQGIHLLLPLPCGFEICQRALHPLQVSRKTGQFGFSGTRLLGVMGCLGTLCG